MQIKFHKNDDDRLRVIRAQVTKAIRDTAYHIAVLEQQDGVSARHVDEAYKKLAPLKRYQKVNNVVGIVGGGFIGYGLQLLTVVTDLNSVPLAEVAAYIFSLIAGVGFLIFANR